MHTWADPGFQVRGWGALKKNSPRGAKIVGVFRVKNHDFTQKKSVLEFLLSFANKRNIMHIFKSVQTIGIWEQWDTPHIKPSFLAYESFIIMFGKEENMNNKQALCRVKRSLYENIVYYLFCLLFVDHIGGVIDRVTASGVVDREFEPRSGQTKYYKIGICLLLH